MRRIDARECALLGWHEGAEVRVDGTVERLVFGPKDDGFAIISLALAARDATLSVKGCLGEIAVGQVLRIDGEILFDPKWGPQMKALRCIPVPPSGKDGVLAYLKSFDGIGEVIAARLVAKYGEDARAAICADPHAAARAIPGLAVKVAEEAKAKIEQDIDRNKAVEMLYKIGLTATFVERCYKKWGAKAAEVVMNDPYILVREIDRIGFSMADGIALNIGISRDDIRRRKAAISHTLDEAAQNGLRYEENGRKKYEDSGHCYLTWDVLVPAVDHLVGQSEQAIREAVDALVIDRLVEVEDDRIYSAQIYSDEQAVAYSVRRIARGQCQVRGEIEKIVGGQEMDEMQVTAAQSMITSAFSVVTGAPGTGKTTIVRAAVEACRRVGRTVALCAPTGRAAKRLSEQTGCVAHTVHRLLDYGPMLSGKMGFRRNGDVPIEADLIVCDEASMIDVSLMRALLRAVKTGTAVVLVGDVNQLPSIGPGQVLYDVIESGVVNVVQLVKPYRQTEGGEICDAAVKILDGKVPVNGEEVIVRSISADDEDPLAAEIARDDVVEVLRQVLPEGYSFHGATNNVRVISPMNKGACGTTALNAAIQAAFNSNVGNEYKRGERSFRVGDPVLQRRNNYDLNLMNGDIGRIEKIEWPDGKNRRPVLTVSFDGALYAIGKDDLDDLDLAYALSTHRSQGSEADVVIMVLLREQWVMLRRNLFYTGFTRAKKCIILVCSERAMEIAVNREETSTRNTWLKERLIEEFEKDKKAREPMLRLVD